MTPEAENKPTLVSTNASNSSDSGNNDWRTTEKILNAFEKNPIIGFALIFIVGYIVIASFSKHSVNFSQYLIIWLIVFLFVYFGKYKKDEKKK